MNLKEFMIRRYGPLPDSGLKKTGPFNLFFGPNEEGKTLTIDALLRMLLGKGVKLFEGVKRVDENPEGYLIIEDDFRKEIKLPEAGTVGDHFNLSPAEFANIFVIRDSDLSISDEKLFYRDITNRLTGLRLGEIEKLKSKICELGGITAGGEFLNTAPLKLKDKIKKALNLDERVGQLLTQLQEEGFSRFEEKLAELKAQRNAAAKQIHLYQAAQNRETYEKGAEALKQLGNALVEVKKLEDYSQDNYEAWQRAESSFEHYRGDLKRFEVEIAAHQETFRSARSSFNEKKRLYKKARQETAAAAEIIEPGLAEYEQEKIDLHRQAVPANSALYNRTIPVSALVMIISLTGLIFQPSWWLASFLIISVILTVLLAGNKYAYLKTKSRLAEIEARVCSEAGKMGLPADHIQAVQSGLNGIRNELSAKEDQFNDAEKWLEWQQKEEERLRAEREEKLRRIKAAEEDINLIRRKAGLETFQEYSEVLNRKDQLKSEIKKQHGILDSHFGRVDDLSSEEARLSFWQEQVAKLQEYSGAAKGLSYDQSKHASFSAQKEKHDRDAKELAEKMQDRSEQLRDIEKEANELLQADEESSLLCQTTVDLEALHQKIGKWLQFQKDNKTNAEIALDILSSIGQEEEEKVTALFGSNNPVSDYFCQITDGYYREVVFESGENVIKVVRADGTELNAYQLSGGAFDQLYFSIRLALGEKLLAGSKGFFILDDPFIKADPARLKLLLDMLFTINAEGWQILYFSAKGEIKAALREKITRGEVQEVKIT